MSESVNKWKSLQVQERISSPPPVVILVIKWNLMKHFNFSQANNDENLERDSQTDRQTSSWHGKLWSWSQPSCLGNKGTRLTNNI